MGLLHPSASRFCFSHELQASSEPLPERRATHHPYCNLDESGREKPQAPLSDLYRSNTHNDKLTESLDFLSGSVDEISVW